MVVDEGLDVAKSISNSDAAAILLILQPLFHGSVEAKLVVRNRRLVEDKVMAKLCLQEY